MGRPHRSDAVRGGGVSPYGVDHARCAAPRVLSGSPAVSRPDAVWSRDAQRCTVVVHEGQAGGGLRGGAGDRGASGSLESASPYPDDLGRGDPTAAVAGGGLLSLSGVAQEVAVLPLHHAEAAGGDARDQSQDRRLVAHVWPGLSGILGGGQGPGWRRGVGVLPGEIRRQSPDLPPTHPERRWSAGALLV